MRTLPAALALTAALVLTSCGDEDGNDQEVGAPQQSTSAEVSPAGCEKAPATATAPAAPTSDLAKKPVVEVPDAPPPCELQVSDIVVGKGAEARTGSMVTMQYVGVTYGDGKEFDASWNRGQPFGPFALGGQQVIAGWDEGIVGMKVGGRRQLVTPPDKAYGAEGRPPVIPPNATLLFVVDLVAVS